MPSAQIFRFFESLIIKILNLLRIIFITLKVTQAEPNKCFNSDSISRHMVFDRTCLRHKTSRCNDQGSHPKFSQRFLFPVERSLVAARYTDLFGYKWWKIYTVDLVAQKLSSESLRTVRENRVTGLRARIFFSERLVLRCVCCIHFNTASKVCTRK